MNERASRMMIILKILEYATCTICENRLNEKNKRYKVERQRKERKRDRDEADENNVRHHWHFIGKWIIMMIWAFLKPKVKRSSAADAIRKIIGNMFARVTTTQSWH